MHKRHLWYHTATCEAMSNARLSETLPNEGFRLRLILSVFLLGLLALGGVLSGLSHAPLATSCRPMSYPDGNFYSVPRVPARSEIAAAPDRVVAFYDRQLPAVFAPGERGEWTKEALPGGAGYVYTCFSDKPAGVEVGYIYVRPSGDASSITLELVELNSPR